MEHPTTRNIGITWVDMLFAAALLLHFSVGAPAALLNDNRGAFTIIMIDALPHLWPYGIGAALIQLLLARWKTTFGIIAYAAWSWAMVYLVVGFYLAQFVDGNALTGDALDWSNSKMVTESILFLAGLFLMLIAPQRVRRVVLIFGAGYMILNTALALATSHYSRTTPAVNNDVRALFFRSAPEGLPNMDRYSKKRNVIVILVDTLQNDVAEDMLRNNDAIRDALTGFTYYTNASGLYPFTTLSVPYLFTGEALIPGESIMDLLSDAQETRMDKVLEQHGYERSYLSLFDRTDYTLGHDYTLRMEKALLGKLLWYRHLPMVWKYGYYDPNTDFVRQNQGDGNDVNSDITTLERMIERVSDDADKPQFKFVHLWGTHLPTRMSGNCRPISPSIDRRLQERQASCIFSHVVRYFDALKKAGLYDNSQIYIVADHGTQAFPIGRDWTHGDIPWSIRASAHPMLMFKDIAARKPLAYDHAAVSLGDVRATVLADEGINAGTKRTLKNANQHRKPRRFIFYPDVAATNKEKLEAIEYFEIGPDIRNASDWKRLPLN